MRIITGATGTNHVTSADDRSLHAGIFGNSNYVLDTGKRLAATEGENNTIYIASGDIIHKGTHARIEAGAQEILSIDSATDGYKRYDLIVSKYTNNGGIEMEKLYVIKGDEGTDPDFPEYVQGDILNGDLEDDFPLYIVEIEGVNIKSITKTFSVLSTRLYNLYTKEEIDTMRDEDTTQVTKKINDVEALADQGWVLSKAMTKTLKTSIEAYSQTKIEGPEIEGVAGARYQLVFPLGYSNLTSQAISRVVENSSKEYNSETGVLKFYVTVNNMSDSAFSYEEEFYILFFSKASAM